MLKIVANIQSKRRVVDAVLTILAFIYVGVYSSQVLLTQDSPVQNFLDQIANWLYVVFFFEFALNLAVYWLTPKNSRSLRTFIGENWISALTLIAPALRSLRVFRALVVLRAFKHLIRNKTERLAFLVIISFPIIGYIGALAVLDAERSAGNSKILTLKDALWWSLTTMTTVGYGDIYPVTDQGKLLASGLLLIGIVLFSSITAMVSAWILSGRQELPESQD